MGIKAYLHLRTEKQEIPIFSLYHNFYLFYFGFLSDFHIMVAISTNAFNTYHSSLSDK